MSPLELILAVVGAGAIIGGFIYMRWIKPRTTYPKRSSGRRPPTDDGGDPPIQFPTT
jgi:hypothetical protein